MNIKWLEQPEEHNYPAAQSFLSLMYEEPTVSQLVGKLRAAQILQFKAKDIFRASNLSLLGVSNSHVVKDQAKISSGIALSPLLLVRDAQHLTLIVADGYHRLCAVYSFNEDALIPFKIC